jgi:hypothetical protein
MAGLRGANQWAAATAPRRGVQRWLGRRAPAEAADWLVRATAVNVAETSRARAMMMTGWNMALILSGRGAGMADVGADLG